MSLHFIRGCKIGKGIFASFIDLEAEFLKYALEPIFMPMLNNVECKKRYGKECHIMCNRFIDGTYAGASVSWRTPGKKI